MKTHHTHIEPLEARIAPAFAASISLGTISSADGFMLSGVFDTEHAGITVSDAGDVNGDGIGDLIVGSEPSSGSSGVSYVVFGKTGEFGVNVPLSGLDGTNGFSLPGLNEGSFPRRSVSGAGDVNGDGFADIIIGVPFADEGGSSRGAAYVVFGKAGGFPSSIPLSSLDGSNGFKLSGIADSDSAGSAVSAAGDVNGDGFDDIIIGAYSADEGGTNRGAAYVFFGKAGGFAPSVTLAALNGVAGFRISGISSPDGLGRSVSGAGDVNGDGFDDLIVGSISADEGGSNRGASYVVFGKAGSFGAGVVVSSLDGTNGFKLSGVADSDFAGGSVSAAGDMNGDGYGDVIIGATSADEGGTNRGAAYVFFGKAGGFGASVALTSLDGTNGFKLSGIANSDLLGKSVSGAGDVNGDGFDDMIVGAYFANEGGTARGVTYVVFGKAGGFGASVSAASLDGRNGFKLGGVTDNERTGVSVSSAGDVNGDGFADLLVGSERGNGGGIGRGNSYVIFGQPDVSVKLSNGGKTAAFLDTDGDLVTVKLTKGALTQSDFTFSGGVWQKLDLGSNPLLFGGTNITVAVKKGFTGDGKVNLGAIDARGLDLGTVTLPGDLGQIDAGDGIFKTPAIKALAVGSLGAVGGTQPATTSKPLQSDLTGTLGKLTVKGSVKGAINITGGTGANLGSVSIGGDLDGSAGGNFAGLLRAGGNIGAVTVKGSVIGGADFSGIIAGGKLGKVTIGAELKSANAAKPVFISALGDFTATTAAKAVAIAGVSVKTNVLNARILAGYTASLGASNADAGIGAISVLGNWAASSIAAGVADSTNNGFGRNDTLIGGDATPTLFASIASIFIKGTATGSAAGGDHFGITAQRVSKLKIGTIIHPLTPAANDILLDTTNNDFRVVDFV